METNLFIIIAVLALACGGLLRALIKEKNARQGERERVVSADAELTNAQRQVAEQKSALARAAEEGAALRQAHEAQRAELAQVSERLAQSQKQLDEQKESLARAAEEGAALRQAHEAQRAELAETGERLRQTEKAAAEKIAQFREERSEFENFLQQTARDILSENSRRLKDENKESLDSALNPLKDNINTFRESLNRMHTENAQKGEAMKTQIEHLLKSASVVTESADNLSRALKGDKKAQGLWGEMQLEKLLEDSGLAKDRDYELQPSVQTPDGRQVPDCVLRMPQGKCLVVDAKVSLSAYARYVSSEPVDAAYLRQQVADLRAHIRRLAEKKYHAAVDGTVDFVLMFMPLEAAFIEALKTTPEIYAEAYKSRIVLTSPTTLMPILRTVAYLWDMHRQQEHLNEIVATGKNLYNKFRLFVDSMNSLGSSLQKATREYDQAVNRLSEGKGNLLDRMQKLGDMGVKPEKPPAPLTAIEYTAPAAAPESADPAN